MVIFELEKVTTGWCKSDSGVRQGCPLPPLIFNIYVSELGKVIYAAERSGRKYVIGREGWKTMIVSKLMYGWGALAWY